MSELRLPLDRNVIRGNKINNAFGMVRRDRAGAKAHQGWDLLAMPLTNCYAIADGVIHRYPMFQSGYGNVVTLEFQHSGRTLFGFYAHLSTVFVANNQAVRCGDVIALTGRSGNASNLAVHELHLHFEIRTMLHPGHDLVGRIDPTQLYGMPPIIGPLFADRNNGGFGLKMKATAS